MVQLPSLSTPGSPIAKPPPNLVTLPPELRLLIYDHLFSATAPTPLHIDRHPQSRRKLEPAIAQIPELRDEVLPEYYKRITCRI